MFGRPLAFWTFSSVFLPRGGNSRVGGHSLGVGAGAKVDEGGAMGGT